MDGFETEKKIHPSPSNWNFRCPKIGNLKVFFFFVKFYWYDTSAHNMPNILYDQQHKSVLVDLSIKGLTFSSFCSISLHVFLSLSCCSHFIHERLFFFGLKGSSNGGFSLVSHYLLRKNVFYGMAMNGLGVLAESQKCFAHWKCMYWNSISKKSNQNEKRRKKGMKEGTRVTKQRNTKKKNFRRKERKGGNICGIVWRVGCRERISIVLRMVMYRLIRCAWKGWYRDGIEYYIIQQALVVVIHIEWNGHQRPSK